MGFRNATARRVNIHSTVFVHRTYTGPERPLSDLSIKLATSEAWRMRRPYRSATTERSPLGVGRSDAAGLRHRHVGVPAFRWTPSVDRDARGPRCDSRDLGGLVESRALARRAPPCAPLPNISEAAAVGP